MAEATQKDAEKRPLPGSPEARESGRRNLNSQIAQRQKMLLAGIGAIALIGGGMFIFGGDGDEGGSDVNGAATIDTGGLVNRNLSQREFVASYGNRLDAQGRAIKDLQQAQLPRPEIEQELEALRSENAQMRSDGQAAIDAISAENANLRSQLSDAAKAPAAAPPLPPTPAYGPGVGTGGAVQPPQGVPEAQGGQLSLMSFGMETGKDGKPRAAETAPALLLEASRDYLPPNSYAPATVIVGVDASTGVASQSDPLPVVLRITGPARSVMRGNKLLTTDITGCLVNGAARGDLSAEKVYVKLVRMTCAQPGGRFAVSEVKGFISFAGKSGVRGRVVSREGILRLMVEACRRPLQVKEGELRDQLFALDLEPKQHDRERAFVVRVGRILQRLWQGSKSEAALLSRISIGQHQTELPFDCFALVAITRWALARSVMAVADQKQAALAGFVTKSAIAIWKATQSWPRLDQEAELEFVGKLDAALGIDREEAELLLKHYTQLNQQLTNAEAS